MATNTEIEMRWIDAWNDLYDLVGSRHGVKCQLADSTVVDVEACKGWLRDSVYEGYHVRVETGWVLGRPGVIASRWRDQDANAGEKP
ncbi:hypothetical protein VT84_31240 [Gemmata sp. SH-PL17]|uniref:hypothetical protein n=1 Tax=Gemmata sp. SH-PL17 TaxID=1630693 RepID=UPI00078C195F|nr:hypothetical protein [Gemmata sp. SH-PL17]AMV28910.1 hypothetical protein VT84_31240 [Gemmata sp. SH-PL17]